MHIQIEVDSGMSAVLLICAIAIFVADVIMY